MSFFTPSAKKVADIREFLKEASGNSLKYSMEANATHMLYIPFRLGKKVENGVESDTKEIIAIQEFVHTWGVPYKQIACLEGHVVKDEVTGELLNDGTCPFCENVSKAWDIFKYRKEIEESNCTLQGEAREKFMKSVNTTLGNEMKAKDKQLMLYLLVVQFKMSNKQPVINQDTGLPDYELKVMKMSPSFVDKVTKQLETSGVPIEGASIALQYDDSKDSALLAQGRVVTVIYPDRAIVATYPGLLERINQDCAAFTFEGIDSVFSELKGCTTAKAKEMMQESFAMWDAYLEEKKTNSDAKYLEYVTSRTNTPSLGAGSVPQQNGMPQIPNIGGQAGMPNIPNMGGQQAGMPNIPNMNGQVAGMPNIPNMNGQTVGQTVGQQGGMPNIPNMTGQAGMPNIPNAGVQMQGGVDQNKVNQMFNGAGVQ